MNEGSDGMKRRGRIERGYTGERLEGGEAEQRDAIWAEIRRKERVEETKAEKERNRRKRGKGTSEEVKKKSRGKRLLEKGKEEQGCGRQTREWELKTDGIGEKS